MQKIKNKLVSDGPSKEVAASNTHTHKGEEALTFEIREFFCMVSKCYFVNTWLVL